MARTDRRTNQCAWLRVSPRPLQPIASYAAAAIGAAALSVMPVPKLAAQAQLAPALPDASRLPPIAPIARPAYDMEIPLRPGKSAAGPGEQWESYLGGPIVRNVIDPTLIPMLPAAGKANGTAVVFAPGGGFMYLGMNDAEPKLLTARGVTVFVLKYRTMPTERNSQAFLVNLFKYLGDWMARSSQPGAADEKPPRATPEALEDGLTAMRLVRSRAAEWGIDPERVGFMGGSAGGMTAIDVAFTSDDRARPDFVVATISPKKVDPVPSTAPPLFAASSNDDPLFPGTTENLVSAWSKAGRPVEAHFYERGGHGLAKGTTGERWFEALIAWMTQHGWLGERK